MGQCLQAGECRATLVVDEDEAHLVGAVAVRDGGKPADQRLRFPGTRATSDESVRAIRDQVQLDGAGLRHPDPHAQDTGGSAGMVWIPSHARGESVARIRSGDRPPPLRCDRQIVGDAHLRAPGRQACDGGCVPDVHGRSVILRASRAVRARLASTHVDVHARVPQQDGGGAVPPHPRASHLRGYLPRAPQGTLGGVESRDTERGAPRLIRRRREEHALTGARGPSRPHARPHAPGRGAAVR